jgi:large conductance mechanosensitive channel
MLKGFRDFLMRGNVIDLAVAVIIGAAFTKVVNSLVEDLIMPPIGVMLGNVDFTNLFVVLKEGAKGAGLIVGLVVYLIVRSATRFTPKKVEAPSTTKDCPYCLSKIPLKASKCAFCTTALDARGL